MGGAIVDPPVDYRLMVSLQKPRRSQLKIMGRRLSQVDPYNDNITPAIVPYSLVSY